MGYIVVDISQRLRLFFFFFFKLKAPKKKISPESALSEPAETWTQATQDNENEAEITASLNGIPYSPFSFRRPRKAEEKLHLPTGLETTNLVC